MNRVFLISPANCNGQRAQWILKRDSRSEIAHRLRGVEGVPLGEVFSFLSALYFRGKLAYARAFARPPADGPGVLVITPSAGLLTHDTAIRLSKLRGFGRVPINKNNARYRRSLLRDAKRLAGRVGPGCEIVLLGSIGSGKYLDILTRAVGDQLRVPADFVGMGDMQRGALLLRCVQENRELNYIDINGISTPPTKLRKPIQPLPPASAAQGLRNPYPAPATDKEKFESC
ncbi:MAG: hypothetical protein ACREQW_10885 [Candidatus Binatia bacterium]